MKIRLLILDSERDYLDRLSKVFNINYSDDIELYSFSQADLAAEESKKSKFDVVLVSEDSGFEPDERFGCFGYLTARQDIDNINGYKAIFKYQRVEQIYKEIKELFIENFSGNLRNYSGGHLCRNILFTSPCGGTGTSTVAAGYALGLSTSGKKVIYLNLNDFDSADYYYEENSTNNRNMSDVIKAIKSKKNNLAILFQGYTEVSSYGVSYFNKANTPLDMIEFTISEKIELINILCGSGTYDYIIIDMPFGLDNDYQKIYDLCSQIYLVSNSTDISITKTKKALDAIDIITKNKDNRLSNKFALIYNTNSSNEDKGKRLSQSLVEVFDGIPKYSYENIRQLISKVSSDTVKLLGRG